MVNEQAQDVAGMLSQSTAPIGEVLWAAREAKKLTVQDASNYLRFSVKQIVAPEANAFSELPDATITRGFIRNYARYLGLDAEPLLASYRVRVPQPVHDSLYVKSDLHQVVSGVDNRPWLKYILGSILALLFLVAWLLYLEFMPKAVQMAAAPKTVVIAPTSNESTAQPIMPPLTAMPAEAPLDEVGNHVAATLLDSQASSVQAAAVANAQANTTIASTTESLDATSDNAKFASASLVQEGSASFSEQTWMQVKDKAGKVVFESLSPANSIANFKGVPPFEVVVGNANATTLTFLGKNVDMTTHTQNNVARVRLE